MEHADTNKDETAHLHLLIDSIAKIKEYTRGMNRADFLADGKTQSAVIMQLQVIGELAKKVPEHIRQSIEVPWKQMAGLRDLVSHDYFGLDLEVIWHTVLTSIPETERKLDAYLASASKVC